MTPRSPKVLVFAAAALSAGTVLAGAWWLSGQHASAGHGPTATAIITRIAPVAYLELDLPPETGEPVIIASLESEQAGVIDPNALLRAETVPGFASAFALRPALSERDLVARFEGRQDAARPAAASLDEDLPVIVVSRVVTELPPRRPAGLSADLPAEAVATDVSLLDILPPARPSDSRLRFASLDPTVPLVAEDPAAPPPVSAPSPGQGLFGILGRLAHPGTGVAPGPVLPGEGPGQTGIASWYGPGFHGRRTASGERFNQNELTAAHRTLPFGTRVRVIDETTGKSIVVRINDRGPFKRGRIIDLSRGSAQALGVAGLRRVKVVSAED